MRYRTITALLAVFALVFAAAPAAAETPPSGTATTEMLGVELEIGGVDILGLIQVDGVDLSALDLSTLATTADDPFAEVDALPLRIGEAEFGRTTVSSSGGEEASGQTPALNELLAGIGAIDLRASTTADSAEALFAVAEGVSGQLGLLGDATIDLSGVLGGSLVSRDGAVSGVGLTVDGVALDLEDLLGADLLAALPLGTLLELAEHLLGEVDGLAAGAFSAAHADVSDAIAALESLTAQLGGDLAALADDLDDVAGDIATIEDDLDDLSLSTLAAMLAKYGTECPLAMTVDALTDCLEGLIDDLSGQLEGAAGDVADTLGDIQDALGDLESALEDLLDAILDLLDDALGILDDLLTQLGDADLLDLGEIAIGMGAEADADDANATLSCAVGGVDVDCIGQSVELAGLVNDAIATITGVVSILGDSVAAGDVVLEIFGEASTTTDTGETNSAAAHLEVLRLEIPSITIDVGEVDGLLDDLSDGVLDALDDLRALLEGVGVQDLLDDVDDLLGTGLGDGADAVLGTIDDLEAATGGVLAAIEDVIDDLLDVIGGALPDVAVSTPSLNLVIDPTTTAEFTPGAPVDDGRDRGSPTPGDDDDVPALPTTGGGLALLGLLAVVAAAALLRRRPDSTI